MTKILLIVLALSGVAAAGLTPAFAGGTSGYTYVKCRDTPWVYPCTKPVRHNLM